jgi:hypothetical protein
VAYAFDFQHRAPLRVVKDGLAMLALRPRRDEFFAAETRQSDAL